MAASPIRQIAYYVADVREASARHRALYGSGPYLVADNVALAACAYRGRPATLDHSSAYGQWGALMVEFVQQNDPGPSPFHDMYPPGSGRWGMHHVALFVDDVAAAVRAYAAAGLACALEARTATGLDFAMVDTVALHGHMVELYPPVPGLVDFYAAVAAEASATAAEPWRVIRF